MVAVEFSMEASEETMAAAKAGVHLLVEKPLAISNKQAWDMVEAYKKAKKK